MYQIIKYSFIISLACLSLSSCSQSQIDDDRRNTIRQSMDAFAINDSIKLYHLIDTTILFKVHGKDDFIKRRDRLYADFSKRHIVENIQHFSVEKDKLNIERYTIVLPVEETKFDSVKLAFEFYNNDYSKASYLEVLWHPKEKDDANLLKSPLKKN